MRLQTAETQSTVARIPVNRYHLGVGYGRSEQQSLGASYKTRTRKHVRDRAAWRCQEALQGAPRVFGTVFFVTIFPLYAKLSLSFPG